MKRVYFYMIGAMIAITFVILLFITIKPTVGNFVEIPYFEVELKLSDAAEDKLKTYNGTIIVTAHFGGMINLETIPRHKYLRYWRRFDHKDIFGFGGLHLVTYRIELTDERVARFENIKLPKSLYNLLENKDIGVFIGVSFGRTTRFIHSNCGNFRGYLSEIKGKRLTINCRLFGE